MNATFASLGLVLLLSLAACAPGTDPQTVVVLSAGPSTSTRATYLRVTVIDQAGAEVERRTVSIGAGGEASFPATIPITARDGDASHRFELVAEAFDTGAAPDADAPFNVLRLESGFTADQVVELRAQLTDACIGAADCGPGATCWQGECRGACFAAGDSPLSTPVCGECEICAANGDCSPRPNGARCGCEGDTCQGGECAVAVPLVQVASGKNSTCALDDAGAVYCWGGNDTGQLGVGAAVGPGGTDAPRFVDRAFKWVDVGGRTTESHACAVEEGAVSGAVVCWGANGEGQCGDGSFDDRIAPTAVDSPLAFQMIATGRDFTCGLTAEGGGGDIHCWGRNAHHQIGRADPPVTVPSPSAVAADVTFTDLCAGDAYGCAVGSDGRVYCWGRGTEGQLGRGAGDDTDHEDLAPVALAGRFTDVACAAFRACAIDEDGRAFCWGGEPQALAPDRRFAAIDCGTRQCCAIERDTQELFCWGDNESGQAGVGTLLPQIEEPQAVAPGMQFRSLGLGNLHSCAVRADRALWCWGDNTSGQLARAAGAPVPFPIRVCIATGL